MQFQPSNSSSPALPSPLAWILSWRMRDPNMPVAGIATAYVALIAALMMMQPDFGGTILFAGVWFVMMILSVIDMKRMGAVIGGVIAALTATYFLYDNARHRIDSFIGGGTAYDQVDLGARTLTAGGWTGAGYGLGIRKMSLPEAHTDYIFSVIGEEFGLIACALIVLALSRHRRARADAPARRRRPVRAAGRRRADRAARRAGLHQHPGEPAAFPSKGMTLPLVSYGGSSTIAICLNVGLLLAITRRNPFLKSRTIGLGDRLGFGQTAPMKDHTAPSRTPGDPSMTGASRHLCPRRRRHRRTSAARLRAGHRTRTARPSRRADHRYARCANPGKPDFLPAHVIPAGRFGKNPLSWIKGICARCSRGAAWRLRLFDSFQPSAVVGFGGYPVACPPCWLHLERGCAHRGA